MSEMTCLLCGESQFRSVYVRDALRVVQCRKCGLVFQVLDNKMVSTLDDYYRKRPTDADLEWSGATKRLRDVVTEIVSRYPGGRLLDVGCGSGEFLSVMSQRGLNCVGLEPNVTQAEFARSQGLMVINEPLKEGLFPRDFDVVTFVQVLEHLSDPIRALSVANSYLRLGGMVVIDVPSYNNPRFLLYRALGMKRVVRRDFVKPHLFYYTPRTLASIIQKSGFEVVRIDCGRYDVKFGPNPLLKAVDWVAKHLEIGGIVLYGRRSQ